VTFCLFTLQEDPAVIFWADTATTGMRAMTRASNKLLKRIAFMRIRKY
jgi:hypothetical protein